MTSLPRKTPKAGMLALVALVVVSTLGCVSKYQYEVDRSLLVQENQKLEDALYVTHSQLVDVKRENEALRGRMGGDYDTIPTETPVPRALGTGRRPSPLSLPAEEPAFDGNYGLPEVVVPENGGSELPPDLFQTPSGLRPPSTRTVRTTSSGTLSEGTAFVEEQPLTVPTTPEWGPVR